MAMYPPTRRTASARMGNGGSAVLPRARTPKVQRGVSPSSITTMEELVDRLMDELRITRGPYANMARERILRLLRGYVTAQIDKGKRQLLDGAASPRAGSPRTPRNMPTINFSLEAMSESEQQMNVALAESNARVATLRAQLTAAQLEKQKAIEKMKVAEDKWHDAEERVERAQKIIKNMDEEQWNLKMTQWSGGNMPPLDLRSAWRDTRPGSPVVARGAANRSPSPRKNFEKERRKNLEEERQRIIERAKLEARKEAELERRRAVGEVEKAAESAKLKAYDELDRERTKIREMAERERQQALDLLQREAEQRMEEVNKQLERERKAGKGKVPPEVLLEQRRAEEALKEARHLASQARNDLALAKMESSSAARRKGMTDGQKAMAQLEQDRLQRAKEEKIAKIKLDHQAELDKLHKEYQSIRRKRGGNTEEAQEHLAVSYRKLVSKVLMDTVFDAWHDHSAKISSGKLRMKHEDELQDLVERKTVDAEKGGKSADLLAKKFSLMQLERLRDDCFCSWKEVYIRNIGDNKLNQIDRELARLKDTHRSAGGRTANQLADKMNEKRNFKTLIDAFSLWTKSAVRDATAREHYDKDQKRKEELKQLKEATGVQRELQAERMANKFREKIFLELQEACFDKLKEEWNNGKIQHKERKHEQHVKQMKKEHIARQHGKLEEVADNHYRKSLAALNGVILNEWNKSLERSKREKEVKKGKQELDNLKRQNRQKGDATAIQMANKFRQIQLEKLNQECFVAWHKDCIRTHGQRQVDDQKKKFQQDLDEYKKKTTKRTEKEKEDIATKFYNRQMQELQRIVLGYLSEGVRAEWASRQKKKLEKEYEEKVDKFKAAHRDKGDQTAVAVAHAFNVKRMQKFLQRCIDAWQQEVIFSAAERQKANLERDFDDKLTTLKSEAREKGDKKAEQMAEAYRAKIVLRMANDCFEVWAADLINAKVQKKDEELIKSRKKGDATAVSMAEKFHQELCDRLVASTLGAWKTFTVKGRSDKDKAKAQKQYDDELDRLQSEHRVKGDDKAEKIAATYRKKVNLQTMRTILSKWEKFMTTERGERTKKSAKEKFDKDIADFKSKSREKGDASAEIAANTFRKRLHEKMAANCMAAWRAHTVKVMGEKERLKMEEAYEQEMESLINESRVAGDAKAEKIAENFRKHQMQGLLAFLVGEWHKYALTERTERNRALERNNFDAEIERLQGENRQKGDKKAELIAVQYQKKTRAKMLHRTIASWMKVAAHGRGDRKVKQQADEYNAQMGELKAQHDRSKERGGEVAEQMATTYRKKLEREMMRGILGPWSSYTHAAVAQREAEALNKQFDKELEDLQKQHREKGDATAQQMAKSFNAKRMRGISKELLSEWHKFTLEKRQERLLTEAQTKLDDELEQMKKQQREAGDARAELMALKFREKREKMALQKCVGVWHSKARELSTSRVQAEQTAEHQEKMKRFQDRVTDERYQLAMKFYNLKALPPVVRCITAWCMQMRMTLMKEKLEEQFQEQFTQLEEDVMVLLDKKDKNLKELARKTSDTVTYYDSLMVLMRHYAAWLMAKTIWNSEAAIARMELRQEDELAQMVAQQAHARFKIVSHMGERYIVLTNRSTKQLIWAEWTLNLKINRAVKSQVVDRMVNVSDLTDTIEEMTRKQEKALARLEIVAALSRDRKICHRVLTQWDAVVKASKFFFQEMARQAEHEKRMVDLKVNVTEKASEMLGNMQEDLYQTELRLIVLRCFAAWQMEKKSQTLMGHAKQELRELKLLYDKEFFDNNRDAAEYRLNCARATADIIHEKNKMQDLRLCYHSWREFAMESVYIKNSSVMREEIDKLKAKHNKALAELAEKEEETQRRMLNFINHVQNHRQGQTTMIKYFDEWNKFRCIDKREHRKAMAKERMLTRDHGAIVGIWAEKKLNAELNEVSLMMIWAWWLLDVFEGQMVKEIRTMREKHIEDLAFAQDGERLRTHYRLKKIADWIYDGDRLSCLSWAISSWRIEAKTMRNDKRFTKMRDQMKAQLDERMEWMKTRENLHAIKITGVLSRISRDKYRLQTMLHWRSVAMVSVSTKNFGRDISKLTTRNTQMAHDMSTLRREHGFSIGSLVSDKWQDYLNEVMLSCLATLWWLQMQGEKRFNNIKRQGKMAAERHKDELGDMMRRMNKNDARMQMMEGALLSFAYTIQILRDLLYAPRCFASWKGAWTSSYAKRKIKLAMEAAQQDIDAQVAEARRAALLDRIASMDRAAFLLIQARRSQEWTRYLAAWQRYVSRKKLEAEIWDLRNHLRREKEDTARELDAQNAGKNARLNYQKDILVKLLMDAIRGEAMVRVFVLWHKCAVLSKIDLEKSNALKDVEQRMAAEGRARRIAEAEARRAAELGGAPAPTPYQVPLGSPRGKTEHWRPEQWQPGGGRAANSERCGRMASALWRVARRRLASGLVAMMSNEGLPFRPSARGLGAPGAWSWRPDPSSLRPMPGLPRPGSPGARPAFSTQPVFTALTAGDSTPRGIVTPLPLVTPRGRDEESSFRLPSKSPPRTLGPSSAAAVTNTLDRLARARELIAAGGKEEAEERPLSPISSISPRTRGGASPARSTLAEHATLQAQISELQKYMDRVQERY